MKTLIMFTLAAAMARGCANDYSYESNSHVWTPPGDDAWLRDSAPPVETRPAAPAIAQAPLIPAPPVQPAPAVAPVAPSPRAPEPRKLEPAAPMIPEPPRVT